ncbi:MAG: hypothetical protein CBB68_04625 [Rhodospirillaceae bacterium TMED8]|nr:hypothetical protein [Magnetovibrio sp.]OUT51617.1 MAG: hypothetical protein CBB68_04625 [Rhodospirillaceae bacterium TMED8]
MELVNPLLTEHIFEKFRDRNSNFANIIPSRAINKKKIDIRSVFLYHAGRTGGVALSTAFNAVISSLLEHTQSNSKNFAAGRVEVISPEALKAHHFFIGSHASYGFHNNFHPQPFQLVALVRDPVARVTSSYTKQCMRRGSLPTRDNFVHFLSETDVHNAMTCQLCGLDPGSVIQASHFEIAVANLNQYFTAFCETVHSKFILDYYFTLFNFPNLIQDIPNRTLSAYQLKVPDLSEAILEKNTFDLKLYNWVCDNSRMPFVEEIADEVSPFTVIMYENEKETHSAVKWRLFSTEIVVSLLDNEPELMDDVGALYKRCVIVSDNPKRSG